MHIKRFTEISKKDTKIAGGKGASLGEMSKAKLPIPPGFVMLSQAFDDFLKEEGLSIKIESILNEVKSNDINSVKTASNKIRKLITKASFPEDLHIELKKHFSKLNSPFVAVRSSATAEDSKTTSWAGELETYLNVTENDLVDSIKKCWSSLFTARAIFYRFKNKLNRQRISVAVVIQKMVQSEIAGVCFTVHPVTEDKNEMVIEAGFGLGELIVGGQVNPDTYIVRKNNFSITEINIAFQDKKLLKGRTGNIMKKLTKAEGNQQKISKEKIIKLAKICAKIEKHYKCPQDIEWAYENGIFYITQARPITTL